MIRKEDVIKMIDEWLERLDESDVSEAIECVLLMVKNRIENMPEAEEQDLLLKLPCKVGTDLYVVGTRCLADEEPNEEWCTAHDCDECVYDNTDTVFKTVATKYMLFMLVAETDENYILDKTVFLTKEEAEEALRKKNVTTSVKDVVRN